MADDKIRVMVIEDEEMLLNAVVKKLSASGFDTISCTNAKQAVDYLESLDELPDVIWLDYYLPDMNGIEFMSEIKRNEGWSDIPVLVVSNSASEEKKNAMLALGAKKYVLKAKYKLDDIINMIGEFVEAK